MSARAESPLCLELERCTRSLAGLLGALEQELDAETLAPLVAAHAATFDRVALALSRASSAERRAVETKLAHLRQGTALAADAARRSRIATAEQLQDVRRAREVLARLSLPRTGETCDIAG